MNLFLIQNISIGGILSCAVRSIQDAFPNPNGKYTGYHDVDDEDFPA